MSKMFELQQRAASIGSQMRSLDAEIGDAVWTDEQRSKWGSMKGDLAGVNEKIERQNELRSADAAAVALAPVTDGVAPVGGAGEVRSGADATVEKRNAFEALLRNGHSSLSAEQRELVKEFRAQETQTGEKGGFTLPKEFRAQIIEGMKAYGGLASICQVLNTDHGRDIPFITADDTADVGVLLGESSAVGEEDVDDLGQVIIGAKKLTSKMVRVPNELLQDSGIDFSSFVGSRLSRRLGRGEANLIVNGSGAGTPVQPKGLKASATTVTASGKVNVSYADMVKLKHSVNSAYRQGAQFLFSDDILKKLTELKDGQGRPLWLPAVSADVPASILGHAYQVDDAVESIGAEKTFAYFGDFQQFILRRVNYMAIKRLAERYAEFDQTAFVAFHRFDCGLLDAAAVKGLKATA